jgi:hypothetical protein
MNIEREMRREKKLNRGLDPQRLSRSSGLTKTRVSVFVEFLSRSFLSLDFFCRRGGCNDVVSCDFKEVCVSSQQLKSAMSVAYLLLGRPDIDEKCDPFIKGIITPDRFHIFSIYDFLQKILIGDKNRTYVKKLWTTLCHHHPQFMEVQGTLDLAVRSSKMPKTPPTAGTTVAGLQGVLNVLGSHHVTDATRTVLEDIFARYAAGDMSMIVEVNLNDAEHPQVPLFNYNFQPPGVPQELANQ